MQLQFYLTVLKVISMQNEFMIVNSLFINSQIVGVKFTQFPPKLMFVSFLVSAHNNPQNTKLYDLIFKVTSSEKRNISYYSNIHTVDT